MEAIPYQFAAQPQVLKAGNSKYRDPYQELMYFSISRLPFKTARLRLKISCMIAESFVVILTQP